MNINSVSYSAYAASASITKDKDSVTVEASAVSVSASQIVVADSYVPSEQAAEGTGAITYKPSGKLSAAFIEELEKQTCELLRSLTEKLIKAQSRKDAAAAGLDLPTLAQSLGLGVDAGMSDIQSLADGLHLGIDVSGMSYGEIAGALGIGTTPETAAAAISDDGMWGVDAVATRLIDFAMGLSRGDPSMIAELRDAVTKGFEAVGDIGSLPQVCQDTYAEVMKRFDYWEANGSMDGYGQMQETPETAAGSVCLEESFFAAASQTTIDT